MAPTKTTPKPKPSKPVDNDIHPLTPIQTHEPSSIHASALGSASLPLSGSLRRRSLRLASISNLDFSPCPKPSHDSTGTVVRVLKDPNPIGPGSDSQNPGSDSTKGKTKGKRKLGMITKSVELNGSECEGYERGKGFLNLRSGKKVLKRGMGQYNIVENREIGEGEGKEELENVNLVATNSVDEAKLGSEFEMQNVSKPAGEGDKKRGKRKLGACSQKGHVTGNAGEGSRRRRFSREEKGKGVMVDGDLSRDVVREVELDVESEMKDSDVNRSGDNVALQDRERSRNTNAREHGSRRSINMERFRDIARENAFRFAHFAADISDDDWSSPEPELEPEIEDWPGPFSTAMKIIKDRAVKSVQTRGVSSERSLVASIKWVPKTNQGHIGARFSVPSLQELCLKILAKNVDAIASLDSVPDALRHRLSQLLCDSRKINGHFFELLVGGSPTEIRLRDCSWLTEEQFTKSFQMCDTANLVVLQLDQCGRCLPDYVILATLAQSPRHLPRLTSLSLSGACRLSDGGLRALISSAPALRSINLSLCSLLTSSSLYILAESSRSLLKELYLDDCQGIDATLIVPALMELEHLEVLSVAGIQTVCDEFVKDYVIARGHNMKELVLKDCINLTDASMKVIAEHCPGLCVLDLTNLCKLTDLSIGYLTNGCRALHTLKLCRNPFSDEAIAAFVETTGESLKELSLNNVKKVGYHTTLSLASHATNLHVLDLSWCRNLTDDAFGLIVDSCLSLRLLKLFGCTQVTDVFLNGHSNLQIQIIGLKMSPVLQHVKVPDPHQGALNYSSVSVNVV